MFTHTYTKLHRRFKKSFIGSLILTIAILIGFGDYSSGDEYDNNSIIKTAHAINVGGGSVDVGGGCAGCGGSSGGCGGCCAGDSGG